MFTLREATFSSSTVFSDGFESFCFINDFFKVNVEKNFHKLFVAKFFGKKFTPKRTDLFFRETYLLFAIDKVEKRGNLFRVNIKKCF